MVYASKVEIRLGNPLRGASNGVKQGAVGAYSFGAGRRILTKNSQGYGVLPPDHVKHSPTYGVSVQGPPKSKRSRSPKSSDT